MSPCPIRFRKPISPWRPNWTLTFHRDPDHSAGQCEDCGCFVDTWQASSCIDDTPYRSPSNESSDREIVVCPECWSVRLSECRFYEGVAPPKAWRSKYHARERHRDRFERGI